MKNRYRKKEEQAALERARRLAQTGRYLDSVELEKVVPGGRVFFDNPPIRDELDQLCAEAMERLDAQRTLPGSPE